MVEPAASIDHQYSSVPNALFQNCMNRGVLIQTSYGACKAAAGAAKAFKLNVININKNVH